MYQYFGGPAIGWPQNFMPTVSCNEFEGNKSYSYSLCSVGGPKKVYETFSTRENAKKRMYDICAKYGMQINKIYDDKHDKTYFTDKGSEFHINRVF